LISSTPPALRTLVLKNYHAVLEKRVFSVSDYLMIGKTLLIMEIVLESITPQRLMKAFSLLTFDLPQ
jgi:hypothetical protein